MVNKIGLFVFAGIMLIATIAFATSYDLSVTAVGTGYVEKPIMSNVSTAVTPAGADVYDITGWSGWTVEATGEGVLGNYSGDLVIQGSTDGTNFVTLGTKTGDAGPQYLGSTRGTPWKKLRVYYTPDGVTGDITTVDVSLFLMKYKDN